jgi:hypothetical protein
MNRNVKSDRVCEDWTVIFLQSVLVINSKFYMELQIIQNKIYEIRGIRVMLDFDLSEMYETETKRLKEAVRRNLNRFPPDFMFELNELEYRFLRTQIASLEKQGRGKYSKYQPFAFTEQGVAMLASILNSPKAIEINIAIIRAFIALRQYALGYAELNQKLENFMIETNMQFNEIYQALTEMASQKESQKQRNPIGF